MSTLLLHAVATAACFVSAASVGSAPMAVYALTALGFLEPVATVTVCAEIVPPGSRRLQIFHGDKSRRRRGCDVGISQRQVAAPSRPRRRGYDPPLR